MLWRNVFMLVSIMGHLLSTDVRSSEREILRRRAKCVRWMYAAKGGEESGNHSLAAVAALPIMVFNTSDDVINISLKRAWFCARHACRAFGPMLQAGEKVVTQLGKLTQI